MSTVAGHDPLDASLATTARASAGILIAVGALSVVCGILAVVYPEITLLALAVITGINLVLLGIQGIVGAVVSELETGPRVLVAVLGLLGVLAGLLVIRRPGETLLVVLLAVGVWLVLSGIVEVAVALVVPADRGARLLSALADLILGGLLLALPDLSLGTVAVLAGIAFIVRGVFTVYVGLKFRKLQPDGSAAGAPAG